jgi:2-keto-4-pentenoate hydratase
VALISNQLFGARACGDPAEVPRPTTIAEADGYLIQSALLARHLAAGDSLAGYKVGLSSPDARAVYGAREPVQAFLLSSAVVRSPAAISRRSGPVPRAQKIEAELAFVLGEDLPDGDISVHEVVDATRQLFLAAELVETRWHGVPDLGGLIADDASNAGVVLGPEIEPIEALATETRAEVRSSGRMSRGTITDVMDGPAHAVAWLASALAQHGRRLRAGDLVMSGTFCTPLAVGPAENVIVDFGRLGMLRLEGAVL